MASSALALFSTIAAVEAGTLGVTWSDCGAKHATVTDLEPTTIQTGTTETLTGTGTVDEDVTSAHFTAKVSAGGVQLASCEGDATADIDCKLPLGAGTITVKAVSYPIAAGTTKIVTAVKTSSLIPASLAKVDVAIRATEQNGEDVICLDVHTEKQLSASADIDCSTAACPSQCECSKTQCTDSINTCLADATCAAAQGCALACACSDQQCALNCAATSGSPLALPVATCINSNCASLSTTADVDCSKSACPSQCECSLSACTDSVNTCLADATCAGSQACAMACACSDQQCMLNCASSSGSPLALPVATCINSNCASVEV
jgi:hypothetical protein